MNKLDIDLLNRIRTANTTDFNNKKSSSSECIETHGFDIPANKKRRKSTNTGTKKTTQKDTTSVREIYLCIDCDRKYKTKKGLIKHMESHKSDKKNK